MCILLNVCAASPVSILHTLNFKTGAFAVFNSEVTIVMSFCPLSLLLLHTILAYSCSAFEF